MKVGSQCFLFDPLVRLAFISFIPPVGSRVKVVTPLTKRCYVLGHFMLSSLFSCSCWCRQLHLLPPPPVITLSLPLQQVWLMSPVVFLIGDQRASVRKVKLVG